MNTLAERLKIAREQKGLTQKDVASRAGMSQPTYFKLEAGKSLRTSFINKLADVLSVEARWLESGSGNMRPSLNNSVVYDDEYVIKDVPVIPFSTVYGGDAEYIKSVLKANDVDDVYFMRINDDSMLPLYRQGDLIKVSKSTSANDGYDVVALVDDVKLLRRYNCNMYDSSSNVVYEQLRALNDNYSDIDSRAVRFNIIGVVIEHIRQIV